MTAQTFGSVRADTDVNDRAARRSMTTETKPAFKTTEFYAYLAAIVGVLLASLLVGTTAEHADYFRADKAWFFIVLLTLGYLGSRGLAKAGSREPRDTK